MTTVVDDLKVTAHVEDGCKCPRCWHYTYVGFLNYGGLCDRCCRTLIDNHPEHESVPHIVDNWNKQKEKLNENT